MNIFIIYNINVVSFIMLLLAISHLQDHGVSYISPQNLYQMIKYFGYDLLFEDLFQTLIIELKSPLRPLSLFHICLGTCRLFSSETIICLLLCLILLECYSNKWFLYHCMYQPSLVSGIQFGATTPFWLCFWNRQSQVQLLIHTQISRTYGLCMTLMALFHFFLLQCCVCLMDLLRSTALNLRFNPFCFFNVFPLPGFL